MRGGITCQLSDKLNENKQTLNRQQQNKFQQQKYIPIIVLQFMSSYYQVLRDIETQQVLKRSRLEAELSALSRPINAEVEMARRNLELQTYLEDEEIQREKFIQKELNEAVLRRSRLEVDIETNRIERQATLRRSRLDTEIRTDKVNRHLEKSRLESQIQASRIQSKKVMEDALRRSKVEANSSMFLNKF